MNLSHRAAGTLLTLGLVLLAGLDALLTLGPVLDRESREEPTSQRDALVVGTQQQQPTVENVENRVPIKDLLAQHGLTYRDTEEYALIRTVVAKNTAATENYVVLYQGDRAGTIAWAQTPQAKRSFLQLKEALHSMFSPNVADLTDETQRRPGKPMRDLLTFIDPHLTEERLVFLRVGNLLVEMHIAPKKEELMFGLLEKLSE